MKETYNVVKEKELRTIILEEAMFPIRIKGLSERISERGIDNRLLGTYLTGLVNEGEMKRFPGYLYQASGEHPRQLFLIEPPKPEWVPPANDYDPLPCH